MRYISVFSGIEAATVAWEPLGWEPIAFCEIDEFPSAVLAHRFPNVPNLGDITKVDWSVYRGDVDIIVGGSPCQSFSIAGKREGLAGESGLMFEYIRAVREVMPRYFVWENVPGALSSEKGAAFGQLLREMDAIGYGLAWRVLDAQFFNVAQRRERVFLVGCLGDAERAAEILFERESLRWDSPSSREKRKRLAAAVERGIGSGCECLTPWDCQSKRIYTTDAAFPSLYAGDGGRNQAVAYTLKIRGGCEGGGKGALVQEDMSATLSTLNEQAIFQPTCMDAGCHHCAGFKFHQGSKAGSIGYEEEISPTITADWHVPAVMHADEVVRGCASRAIAANKDHTLFQQANILCLNDQGGGIMSVSEEISPTLRAQTHGHEPIVIDRAAFNQGKNAKYDTHIEQAEVMDTLVARGPHGLGVGLPMQVRKMTPKECERLQGFPDGWTEIPYRGKPAYQCPDTPRYKALGNSMAVPVMRWIGERIDMVELALRLDYLACLTDERGR